MLNKIEEVKKILMDFKHRGNTILNYDIYAKRINQLYEPQPVCPDCGEVLEIDYNSAQCHSCKKLWPLSYLNSLTQESNEPDEGLRE